MGKRTYPISASQVKKYKTCPKQYWYRYVSDIYSTKMGAGYRGMGSAVHEAIENVLLDDPEERDELVLLKKLRAEEERLGYDYPTRFDDDVQKCLVNASKYISSLGDQKIIGIEDDHTFNVTRPDIVHPFRGIMDVCTEDSIIDWKTGTPRPEDEAIQAAIYLAAYAGKYNRVPKEIRFVYLKKETVNIHKSTDDNGMKFWDENQMPDSWSQVMFYAIQILDSWENDGPWIAIPDRDTCHWCDYQFFCKEGGVGVEHIDWDQFSERVK